MLRIFHPIGQGAFYSERHNNFNIVYDCGEWKKSKKSTELVKNSFEPNSTIDILFISHFDYDHISQIETLKNNFKIKRCILPVVSSEQKKILVAFFRCFNWASVIKLVENPSAFFGEETKIIYVEEVKKEGEENNNEKVVDLENEQSGSHIESGKRISISDWLYIPYNNYLKERYDELKKEFQILGLDVTKFKNDIDYCIDNKKTIKEAYNRLTGGINSNSMMVYSGPIDKNLYYIKRLYYGLSPVDCKKCLLFKEIFETPSGCIFTGDSNLGDVLPFYLKYHDRVGTIQLPHHGSAKSFDFDFLRKKNEYLLYFPTSYGSKNSYGHPAQNVVCNVVKSRSYFIHITEQAYTTFIQYIAR